jgi:hypothetical protein
MATQEQLEDYRRRLWEDAERTSPLADRAVDEADHVKLLAHRKSWVDLKVDELRRILEKRERQRAICAALPVRVGDRVRIVKATGHTRNRAGILDGLFFKDYCKASERDVPFAKVRFIGARRCLGGDRDIVVNVRASRLIKAE